MGKILYTVIATVGDLERSLIRERWMVGRERTKAQGETVGRPPTEVDEETIHHLRDKGLKL
jgi:DNA invertase Pin-like site-specific DNA recombinase